jgi:bifunctional enzyme CysN/CysC
MSDTNSKSANEIHQHALSADAHRRAELKGQRPRVIWMTGLSGAGKSTLANMLEVRLAALGRHTYLLDGDNLRHQLNRDWGFRTRSAGPTLHPSTYSHAKP